MAGWVDDYRRVKKAHPDALLLWRVGDFYEALGEDAVVLAKALDVVVVKAGEGKTPMAGFPHAMVTDRVGRLVALGYLVAVVEPEGEAFYGRRIVDLEAVAAAAGESVEPVARQLALFE